MKLEKSKKGYFIKSELFKGNDEIIERHISKSSIDFSWDGEKVEVRFPKVKSIEDMIGLLSQAESGPAKVTIVMGKITEDIVKKLSGLEYWTTEEELNSLREEGKLSEVIKNIEKRDIRIFKDLKKSLDDFFSTKEDSPNEDVLSEVSYLPSLSKEWIDFIFNLSKNIINFNYKKIKL